MTSLKEKETLDRDKIKQLEQNDKNLERLFEEQKQLTLQRRLRLYDYKVKYVLPHHFYKN